MKIQLLHCRFRPFWSKKKLKTNKFLVILVSWAKSEYKFSDRNITIFPNLWYKSGYVVKNGVIANAKEAQLIADSTRMKKWNSKWNPVEVNSESCIYHELGEMANELIRFGHTEYCDMIENSKGMSPEISPKNVLKFLNFSVYM